MRRALEWLEHHAVVFVIIGLVGLGALALDVKGQAVSQHTLRVAQLRACHRLNVMRAEDNRSQLADYRLYSLTINLFAAAIAHPTQPTTPAERQQDRAYLAEIRHAAGAKEWSELTLCVPSVDSPTTFSAPAAVPFSQAVQAGPHGRLVLSLALQQALYVGPGE
jgi:hypothetical protein